MTYHEKNAATLKNYSQKSGHKITYNNGGVLKGKDKAVYPHDLDKEGYPMAGVDIKDNSNMPSITEAYDSNFIHVHKI